MEEEGPARESSAVAPAGLDTAGAGPLGELALELMQHAPFEQMTATDVEQFLAAAEPVCFAPGEILLSPAHGPVRHLLYARRGAVTGRNGMAELSGGFFFEAGDLFPVGAVLGRRAITATYESQGETLCLRVPIAAVHALALKSAVLADFLNRRVAQFFELSRRALQARVSSNALAQQSLEAPLGALPQRAPAMVRDDAPLGQALALMHERRIGSVLVVDAAGVLCGILTRHDILGRVTLPGQPLDSPVAAVMTTPVHGLAPSDTGYEAALLMSRHGIRHVPVVDAGRPVGIVSERDLFALQRLSIKHLSSTLRGAGDAAALRDAGADIRQFATQLLAQGLQARQLTELISHLNDRLTVRAVELLAGQHGLDLRGACWLAFGSEGREEQTLATDQDNGLVFSSVSLQTDRPRWLAFGQAVNELLAECGYPLCSGGVMAGRPQCCLSSDEWRERFGQWIDHGAPQDLLNATIYFDLRPLAGELALGLPLRELIVRQAGANPRFLRQMAENALTHRAPLSWHGGLAGEVIDLKLQGTAIFVEAARLLSLAAGVDETSTRARLLAVAGPLRVPEGEAGAWVAAFEHLQMLRLGLQTGGAVGAAANRCEIGKLNDPDRRLLRETLRVARRLQQRIELDYMR